MNIVEQQLFDSLKYAIKRNNIKMAFYYVEAIKRRVYIGDYDV
jgi:hypothetical protein